MNEHILTTQNLYAKLYGSGAGAADISAQITSASTLFSEAKSIGSDTQINSVLAANASAIQAIGPNLTNSQVQMIFEQIQTIVPAITEAEIYSAVSGVYVSPELKNQLLSQGIVPVQGSYLFFLMQVQNSLNGGVLLASSGIVRSTIPRIEEAHCTLFYVSLVLLIISSMFTGGISAGIIGGIEITWGSIFGSAAGIFGLFQQAAGC